MYILNIVRVSPGDHCVLKTNSNFYLSLRLILLFWAAVLLAACFGVDWHPERLGRRICLSTENEQWLLEMWECSPIPGGGGVVWAWAGAAICWLWRLLWAQLAASPPPCCQHTLCQPECIEKLQVRPVYSFLIIRLSLYIISLHYFY